MNITDALIAFRNTQDASYLRIDNADENMENLNVIVIEILSWLKLEHKRALWQMEGRSAKQKPLRLNKQYPWCNYLRELLNSDNTLSDIFIFEDDTLGFKANIDDTYRSIARKKAYEQYNPQKII